MEIMIDIRNYCLIFIGALIAAIFLDDFLKRKNNNK